VSAAPSSSASGSGAASRWDSAQDVNSNADAAIPATRAALPRFISPPKGSGTHSNVQVTELNQTHKRDVRPFCELLQIVIKNAAAAPPCEAEPWRPESMMAGLVCCPALGRAP